MPVPDGVPSVSRPSHLRGRGRRGRKSGRRAPKCGDEAARATGVAVGVRAPLGPFASCLGLCASGEGPDFAAAAPLLSALLRGPGSQNVIDSTRVMQASGLGAARPSGRPHFASSAAARTYLRRYRDPAHRRPAPPMYSLSGTLCGRLYAGRCPDPFQARRTRDFSPLARTLFVSTHGVPGRLHAGALPWCASRSGILTPSGQARFWVSAPARIVFVGGGSSKGPSRGRLARGAAAALCLPSGGCLRGSRQDRRPGRAAPRLLSPCDAVRPRARIAPPAERLRTLTGPRAYNVRT